MRIRRVLSLVLTGLILFGISVPSKAKSETKPMNIKSILNMTEEQSEKTTRLKDIMILYVDIYGKLGIAIPVFEKEIRIESDDSSYTTEDWIIKQSKFNEIFYNPKIPNGFDVGKEIFVFKEVSSGDILGVDDMFSPEIFVNDYFFKDIDNERYLKEGNGVSRVYGFDSIIEAAYLFDKNIELDIEKKYSLKEVKELYQKLYLREEWPVEEILNKNSKLNIPQFKTELLNESLDNEHLMLICSIEKKSYLTQKVLLAYINKEDKNIYDLITGKFIMNNSKIDTKYLTSIGIRSKELRRYNINEYITLYDIFLSNHDEKFYGLYEMGSKFQTAKTIGDVLEVYSYLPEGFEPDYSHFDFSNSPNVDPAWLASQPAPPPYAELTVGSSGQEVLDMKQRFYDLGYYRTTSFNDRFTDNTADTVRLFEKNNGLPADGVADAGMLGVLFSDKALGK